MTDYAYELAARHRQPQVLEHRGLAAASRRKALGDAFDRDELLGHGATHAVSFPRIRSRACPRSALMVRMSAIADMRWEPITTDSGIWVPACAGTTSERTGIFITILTPGTSPAAWRGRGSGRGSCRPRRSPGSR